MGILDHVGSDIRIQLELTGSEEPFQPGQILFAGRTRAWCGVVKTGLVRIQSTLPDGRVVTDRNVAPGGLVGLAALLGVPTEVSAQAVGHTRVLRLDSRLVSTLRATSLAFNRALVRELYERIVLSTRDHHLRTRGSLIRRLAYELVEISADLAELDPVTVAVTHETLAESLGTSREVVSRKLALMKHVGLVRQLGRGLIELQDRNQLLGFARSDRTFA